MADKYILRKQLNSLPCRFILGIIAPLKELSLEVNPRFIDSVNEEIGPIEGLLPVQDFLNPPESYLREMGNRSLSTTLIILEKGGTYTDLHHMKNKTMKLEKKFMDNFNNRTFNINPGAVGTYGLCLVSHKPSGSREDISTYAFGPVPNILSFRPDFYYERIMKWEGERLIPLTEKFPEYTEINGVKELEKLVKTLPKNETSVELLAYK